MIARPVLFHFPDEAGLASRLCSVLNAEAGVLSWHRFPDNESLVQLESSCEGRDVIVLCGLHDPDPKFLPLYFAVTTARELGARRVGLVAPYLAYMRQDVRFEAGQCVSAFAFGRLMSGVIDWLVTVDPHLHRIHSLDEAYSIPATVVSAVPAIADWVGTRVSNPVFVGPDSESEQWARNAAQALGVPWTVLEKVRSGDRDVRVSLRNPQVLEGRTPVVIDDISSSGRTLVETVRAIRAHTAAQATCVIVHALFEPGAEAAVLEAGAAILASTNTVPHRTNAVDIVPALASAIGRHLEA